jgi:hypothetical protein
MRTLDAPISMSSGTQLFIQSLPLQACFAGVFVLTYLLYQLVWVVSSLLIGSMFISEKEADALLEFSRRGLVGKFLGFLVLLLSTCLKLASAFAQTCVLLVYACLPLLILAGMFSLLEQRWGDSAVMVGSILNNPDSPVASTLQMVVRVPLQVLDLVASYVLPVYNLFFYLIFNIPGEMLVQFFIGKGGSEFTSALKAISQSVPLMASAAGKYVRANPLTCPTPDPTCWEGVCWPVDASSVAAACLDSRQRAFDFGPGLEQMRLACAHLFRGLAVGCESLHVILNVLLFPITDPQLWKALGALLNGILYFFVGVPTTTNARCVLAGGFEMRPAMCTPDFGPMFDYGVTAFAALGNVLDNFLDMAYLIVVYGPDTPCPTSQSNAVNLDWALDPLALSLFGTNTTVLITLGASSWALTDGQHALFVRSSTTVRRSYFPNIWGNFPVNPRQALFLFCCGWSGR